MKANTQISEYILEECLGGSAHHETWRARHEIIPGRQALIKLALKDLDSSIRTELGRKLASIQSPHGAKVLTLSARHETPYIITEMLAGPSLYQRLAHERLSDETLSQVIWQLSWGLADIHRAELSHGSVNSKNLLFDGDSVKLTDTAWTRWTGEAAEDRGQQQDIFELAKLVFEASTGVQAKTGEQIHELDARRPRWISELYSQCIDRALFNNALELVSWLENHAPALGAQAASFGTGDSVGSEVEETSSGPLKLSLGRSEPDAFVFEESVFVDSPGKKRRSLVAALASVGLLLAGVGGLMLYGEQADQNAGALGHINGGHIGEVEVCVRPTVAQDLYAEAKRAYLRGQYMKADELLKRHHNSSSPSARSLTLHGHVFSELGLMKDSIGAYEEALSHDSSFAEAYLGQAEAYEYLDTHAGHGSPHGAKALYSFTRYLKLVGHAKDEVLIRGRMRELAKRQPVPAKLLCK